jgi:hypothetical protein
MGSFQIGKYYKHTSGQQMHIISAGKTTLYGWCLIAEKHGQGDLHPVGSDKGAAQNWEETTEEDWMKGFSN